MLQGWIDFNRDGDWDDPGEQVAISESVWAGTNQVRIRIPDPVPPTERTHARFRLSGEGELSPGGGPAPDGEVEDYQVAILPGSFRLRATTPTGE